MRPVLLRFELGGAEIVLGSYSTFYMLAWVIAPLVAVAVAASRGLPWRRALAVYGLALVAGVTGARLFDLGIAGDFYAEDPSRVWSLNFQGFSLYGGFLIATIVAIALARALDLPLWRLADAAVPGLVVGVMLMRTGCFLRGCCFGEVTQAPWGVSFPVGSPPWAYQLLEGRTGVLALFGKVYPVHPTQLYEIAAAVMLGALALWLMRLPGVAEGVGFLAFALGFTLFRLGNDFLRARQPVITAPEWFYPAFYSVLAAVLFGLLTWRVQTKNAHDEASLHPHDRDTSAL